jgi:hypothetical protein
MVAVSGLLGPGAVVGQVKVPRVAETPGVARLTGSNPAQWRLIWTDNPQTKVTVSWSTAKKGSRHRVYYDTASHKGKRLTTYRHQQKTLRDGQHSVGIDPRPSELHYHHAVLDKLQPSTTYYFTIASGRSRSPEFRFVTAPADDRPFSIVFGGDSRTDIQGRRRVNRFLSELIGKNDDILAFAHGGDFVTTGTSLAQWSAWLSDHELTATRDGRMIPIIPTRGNHEAGAPQFDEVFNAPGGVGRNYYTTMLGPKVLFVTLNTEIAMTGDQRKFLAAQLLANRAVRWQVAQYHRPAWPAFKRPSGAFRHWVPLFEQHKLDIACEADGHVLKRTVPIRDQIEDPEGVVYIGEGGLGVTPREPKADRWYLKPPGKTTSGHHVQVLTFSPKALRVRAILLDGTVFDDFARKPRGRPPAKKSVPPK